MLRRAAATHCHSGHPPRPSPSKTDNTVRPLALTCSVWVGSVSARLGVEEAVRAPSCSLCSQYGVRLRLRRVTVSAMLLRVVPRERCRSTYIWRRVGVVRYQTASWFNDAFIVPAYLIAARFRYTGLQILYRYCDTLSRESISSMRRSSAMAGMVMAIRSGLASGPVYIVYSHRIVAKRHMCALFVSQLRSSILLQASTPRSLRSHGATHVTPRCG